MPHSELLEMSEGIRKLSSQEVMEDGIGEYSKTQSSNDPEHKHTLYTQVPYLVSSPASKMDTSIPANEWASEKSGPHSSLHC